MKSFASAVAACSDVLAKFRTELDEEAGMLTFFRRAVPVEEGRRIGALLIGEGCMDCVTTADPDEIVALAMASRAVVSAYKDEEERIDPLKEANMVMAFNVIEGFFPKEVGDAMTDLKDRIPLADLDGEVVVSARSTTDWLCYHLSYDVYAAELSVSLSNSDDPDDPDIMLLTVSVGDGPIFSFRKAVVNSTTLKHAINHLACFHAALDKVEEKWSAL